MSHVVTLAVDRRAATLPPGVVASVRDASGGGAVTTLSPGEAVDIAADKQPERSRLLAALAGLPIDCIVTEAAGRRKRLLIADMDSTIVTSETLDEIGAYAGMKDQIAAITGRSMRGEIDFATALRERVAMLKGLDLGALEKTWATTQLTEGAHALVATMRAHGARTALVSGGFTYFTARVASLVGFDLHRANTLFDDGTALTGHVAEPILDRDAKLATLHELAGESGLDLADTLAVGDGANDLAMIRKAGLGVAFHAKPIVAEAAGARVDHGTLRSVLFAQGYAASEFVID